MDHTMQQQQVGFISEGSIKQTVLLLLQFKTLKYVSQLKEFYGKWGFWKITYSLVFLSYFIYS